MAKKVDKKNNEIVLDVYEKIIDSKSKVGRDVQLMKRRLDELKRNNK